MSILRQLFPIGFLLLLYSALCHPLPHPGSEGFLLDLNELPADAIDGGAIHWLQAQTTPAETSNVIAQPRFSRDRRITKRPREGLTLDSPVYHSLDRPPHNQPQSSSVFSPQEFHVSHVGESSSPARPSNEEHRRKSSKTFEQPHFPRFNPARTWEQTVLADTSSQVRPNRFQSHRQQEPEISAISGSASYTQNTLPYSQSRADFHQNIQGLESMPNNLESTQEAASASYSSTGQMTRSSAFQPLLPKSAIAAFKRVQSIRVSARKRPNLLALIDQDEAQVRLQSVRNPAAFSGAKFVLTFAPDPKVDQLVAGLRASLSTATSTDIDEHTSRPALNGDIGPAKLTPRVATNLSQFFIGYFRKRLEAKQVVFRDADGPRSLLLIPLTNYRIISGRRPTRKIGAWEIASHPTSGMLRLYFRGFLPFSKTEFQALEHQPGVTGDVYWLQRDNHAHSESGGSVDSLTLKIVKRKGHSGGEKVQEAFGGKQAQEALGGERVQEASKIEPSTAKSHPDMQTLIRLGELSRILSLSRSRHLYIYQQSPRTIALIRRWKGEAQLFKEQFIPLQLKPGQLEDFALYSAGRYRTEKQVKVITEDNGEMFMLDFYPFVPWLSNSRNTVAVWQLGPAVQGRRLMICRGFFGVDKFSYDRLTPDAIEGLHTAAFQNNMAGLP